jgi:hypothetical protein
VVTYRLVTLDNDNEVEEYDEDIIEMDEDFLISIDTSDINKEELYIEASTYNSLQKAYLPLVIYITNFAPYFTDGPPLPVQIAANETSFTFDMPEISDGEESSLNI